LRPSCLPARRGGRTTPTTGLLSMECCTAMRPGARGATCPVATGHGPRSLRFAPAPVDGGDARGCGATSSPRPGRAGRGGPDRLGAVVHQRQPRPGASRRCGREGKPAPREPADRAGAHPRRVHAQACTSSLTATACHWPSRSAPAKRTRAGDDAELVRIAARLLGFRRVVSDLQANGLRSIGHMAVFWVAIKVLTLRVISANASYREKFFCNLCA
jgi:hypothetical protein